MTQEKNIGLRPVIESDLDLFETLTTKRSAEPYQWFGFLTSKELRSRFLETGLLTPDGGNLTVTVDEEPAGRVEWFKSHWGWRDISVCWTIAIAILRERRGTVAQPRRLVTNSHSASHVIVLVQ